jgi:ATP adenylyltransferase
VLRPDRFKYVRKLLPESKGVECVFCEAEKLGVSEKSLVLFQSKHSMVMLNKFPYNSGHVLVLPRTHIGHPLKLSDEQYTDLHLVLRKALGAVEKAYQPAGLNFGLNLGAAAGAGIPDHLHYHLVPRWNGDLNFFPLVAETKVVVETLESSFARLLSCFNE